ncbi:hypothetical protein PISL3812_03358 [Talaromyces islandicus]|uniref:Uncharacterized protein n=1 Tax=Talaromyces islandicus TaxID=28573 RepID=A0A0U1LSJ0_TALIS|nr:hypothetical protein PISL3812_03358 [Talaromyces islandicus]
MATQTETKASLRTELKAAFDEKTHDGVPSGFLTDADKSKPNILRTGNPDVVVNKLTPRVGTEIRGLQLSGLTDAQKNGLALLIAERGVVVFTTLAEKPQGVNGLESEW